MKLYRVSVKLDRRKIYFPAELTHEGVGFVWMKDEDHIWFKFIRQGKDSNGNFVCYLSSPTRYCWDDINTECIADEVFDLDAEKESLRVDVLFDDDWIEEEMNKDYKE
jgi:hypothetical protein